MAAEADPIAG